MKSLRHAALEALSRKKTAVAVAVAVAATAAASAAVIGYATLHSATAAQATQAPRPNVQQLDFGKEGAIPLNAVRREALAPVVFSNEKELELRLVRGGDLEVSQSALVVGHIAKGRRGAVYMALDTLTLLERQSSPERMTLSSLPTRSSRRTVVLSRSTSLSVRLRTEKA